MNIFQNNHVWYINAICERLQNNSVYGFPPSMYIYNRPGFRQLLVKSVLSRTNWLNLTTLHHAICSLLPESQKDINADKKWFKPYDHIVCKAPEKLIESKFYFVHGLNAPTHKRLCQAFRL